MDTHRKTSRRRTRRRRKPRRRALLRPTARPAPRFRPMMPRVPTAELRRFLRTSRPARATAAIRVTWRHREQLVTCTNDRGVFSVQTDPRFGGFHDAKRRDDYTQRDHINILRVSRLINWVWGAMERKAFKGNPPSLTIAVTGVVTDCAQAHPDARTTLDGLLFGEDLRATG
jgi:hypothetical protein